MDIVKLRELLERELSSNELAPLDEEFYKEFDSLVRALKLRAESSKERGETVEERLYLAELNIAENLMKEIIKIRLHKIVDLAFEGRPQSLVSEEKKIFAILMAFINREPLPLSGEVEFEEVAEEEGKIKAPVGKRVIWEAYLIKVDIPKVLDEKLREYGPFKAGDLVTLPKSIGRILVERDAAKLIDINP
ncbi:hypothetical protein VFC49_11300 [Thermococcus sp. SY098]|uniref:DNA replication complex subunit Gins51 n=1 Tax=Thermococcus sp. SY098 TaxID=3111325 RepID=UPI002D7748BB|nr:hypothetical protein [Thermococcus sp. SY098]WRS52568.1 hypothetical protein VFC49_11300 [Thermococcus sp. SY098]